jgi:O-antigen/teichoic acid export membrane protein
LEALAQLLEINEVSTPPQQAPKSLRHNFSWTLASNLIYAACQWGILVVLTKWMSPEVVGRFTIGMAITAPVFMFANLSLRSVQATDARREYLFGEYLALRLLAILGALLTIAGIVVFHKDRAEIFGAVLFVGLAKAWESLSDLYYGQLQQHESMACISQSLILKGILSLLCFTAGLLLTDNLLGGLAGIAMAQAMIWVFFDRRNLRNLLARTSNTTRPLWHWSALQKLLRLSLPLGVVMLLISLNDNIPRYFVEALPRGNYLLGIFGALAYLMVAGMMLVNALGESSVARLARFYAAGDIAAFRTLILKLTLVGSTLGGAAVLGAWLVGRPLLTLLYRPEYAEYSDVLLLLAVAAAIGCVQAFLSYGLGAARYYRIQVPIFLLVCLSIIGASASWIPIHGLHGAAYALIVGAGVRLVLTLLALNHAMRRARMT